MQIPDSSRFLVGQYVTVHDDVISHVNITNVKNEDGGEYSCTAQNSIGKYVHHFPRFLLPFVLRLIFLLINWKSIEC